MEFISRQIQSILLTYRESMQNMDKWNNEKLKFWLEAGLALLLVLTLGLAGARGIFAKDIEEKSVSAKTKVEQEKGEDAKEKGSEAEKKDKAEENAAQETEEVIADGQYPIMGESNRWFLFLKSPERNIRQKHLEKAAQTALKHSVRCIMTKRSQKGCGQRWRLYRQ